MLGVSLWAFFGSRWVEPNLSSNADEHVYVQQAWLLAHGRLSVPAPPGKLASNFQPWFSVPTSRGYVMKYDVVWPGVIAGGVILGAPRLGLSIAAGLFVLGVFLLAEAVLKSRRRALLAAAIITLTPLTIVQSTTFLPYIIFGALWTLAAAFMIRGVHSRRPFELIAAGSLTGLAISARPYDGVLVLAPFSVWAAWTLARDRKGLSAACTVLAAAMPIGAGEAIYNKVVTGGWKTLPFSLWSPIDKLGFGPRGLSPQSENPLSFGIHQGLHGVRAHLIALNGWSFGGLILLAIAALGLARARRKSGSAPLALVAIVLPVGYVFFWGSLVVVGVYGSRFGPYYFLPVLVPVAVFAAEGLVLLWSRWQSIATVGVCAMVALAGLKVDRTFGLALAERNAGAQPYHLLNAVEHDPHRTLVFLPGPYIGHLIHGRFSHGVGPSTRVLYAVDRDNQDVDLVEAEPTRRAYRLLPCDWSGGGIGTGPVPRSGRFEGQLLNGRGSRLIPLEVVNDRSIKIRINLPHADGVDPMRIDVAAGTARATIMTNPGDNGGSIDVLITGTGISVTGPVGSVTPGRGPDGGLSIHVGTNRLNEPAAGYAWDTPARVTPQSVTVLSPAILTHYAAQPSGSHVITLCDTPPTIGLEVQASSAV